MLTCKALAQQNASDYLDNQLTPRQRFGVHVHLMLCRNCRRFIKQLNVIRDVVRRDPQPIEEAQVQATAVRLHEAFHEQNKSGLLL